MVESVSVVVYTHLVPNSLGIFVSVWISRINQAELLGIEFVPEFFFCISKEFERYGSVTPISLGDSQFAFCDFFLFQGYIFHIFSFSVVRTDVFSFHEFPDRILKGQVSLYRFSLRVAQYFPGFIDGYVVSKAFLSAVYADESLNSGF